MSPIKLIDELLAGFSAQDPMEAKFVAALREVVGLQKFDSVKGQLEGPRMNLKAIATRADLPLKLISYEGCKLQATRELLMNALKLLSQYSLQVECDYLKEENRRLQARLERADSAAANRVVLLYKQKSTATPTPASVYSAQEVRDATRVVVPMDKL